MAPRRQTNLRRKQFATHADNGAVVPKRGHAGPHIRHANEFATTLKQRESQGAVNLTFCNAEFLVNAAHVHVN
jgi:hypothetical protein